MSQKFPKAEHLKRKKIIDQLFVDGKSVKIFPVLLVYKEVELPEESITIQAGFSVSKRNHKHAVTRNRIKRLLREAYRKNKHIVETNERTFAFMFIYMSREILTYADIEKIMIKVLNRFAAKLSETSKTSD